MSLSPSRDPRFLIHCDVPSLIASAYLPAARDFIYSRTEQMRTSMSQRGARIATFTVPGIHRRDIALLNGVGPIPGRHTVMLIENEVIDDPAVPGQRQLRLFAWTLSAAGIGYTEETVDQAAEWEAEEWELPETVPLIQNHAEEDGDGEKRLHLYYMQEGEIIPDISIKSTEHQPTTGQISFVLRACGALLACNGTTYNEDVTELA